MAAETLTGPRAKKGAIVPGHGYGAAVYSMWGSYSIAANVEDGDIFELFKVPAGFLCLGGQLVSADLDTNATETLDMDLGWAANDAGSDTWTAPWGTTYTNAAASADPDGLLNAGVWVGDAVAGITPGGGVYFPLVLPTPLWFADETMIQLEANAAAATFAAGTVTVRLDGQIWPK